MEVNNGIIINILKKIRLPNSRLKMLLYLYFPIGIIFAIVRIFMLLQVYFASIIFSSHVYVKSFILRIMAAVLGILVLEDKSESNCIKNRGLLVCNHISVFDFAFVHLLTDCLWPVICTIPDGFINCIGLKQISSDRNVTVPEVSSAITNYLAENNRLLLVFFEKEIKKDHELLKFSSWWIDCNVPIQPVAIRMMRPPFSSLVPAIINPTWYTDIMWTFFSPFSIYIIKYLPVMQGVFPSKEEIVSRVESLIDDELQSDVSKFHSASSASQENHEKKIH